MEPIEEMLEETKEKIIKPKRSPGRFFVILGVLVIIFSASGAIALATIDDSYKDRVYPGVHVGTINIGGMQRKELEKFLKDMNDKLAGDGFRFTLKNESSERKFTLFPLIVSESNARELMHIDEKKEADRLVNLGKKGTFVTRLFTYARTSWTKPEVPLESIFIDEKGVNEALSQEVESEVIPAVDADIIVDSRNPVHVTIIPAQVGVGYDFSPVKSQLFSAWSKLQVPEINLHSEKKNPLITEKEISVLTKNIDSIFAAGSIVLTTTQDGEQKQWEIKDDTLQRWIGMRKFNGDQVGLGVKEAEVAKYLEYNVEPDINVDAEDARFTISEDGQVQEFEGSKFGTKINQEKTIAMVNDFVHERSMQNPAPTSTVELVVETVEPEIKTGQVNDLGIKQILGVGVSNFKGSPTNRIHNITLAVKKLNGILVKPGEEFSAIARTQPYTIEAGYLPEKVIKGDKITPEIGGGLCQVGTTLFRMAMNSGMDITERRNHSLVVSYYNDPSNGQPGTDATIYDPSPDFKFKNDTENYVLIQTSINPTKGDLKFTLWGTSDGRTASYSKPVVSRWIPTGPTKTIESSSLKAGAKECQHAFPGADTSFVYTRVLSDGTEQKKVFESHYRPLPEICLVGVDKSTAPCTGANCPVKTTEILPLSDAPILPPTPANGTAVQPTISG